MLSKAADTGLIEKGKVEAHNPGNRFSLCKCKTCTLLLTHSILTIILRALSALYNSTAAQPAALRPARLYEARSHICKLHAYILKLYKNLGVQVGSLLRFLCMQPANQPRITAVVICQKELDTSAILKDGIPY
jgi:hypothetical protein